MCKGQLFFVFHAIAALLIESFYVHVYVGEKCSISGYLRDVNKRLTVAHFLLVIVALINQVSALAAVSNVSAESIGKLTRAVEAVEAAGMRNGTSSSSTGNKTPSHTSSKFFKQFITKLNAQHVNGMTHFSNLLLCTIISINRKLTVLRFP